MQKPRGHISKGSAERHNYSLNTVDGGVKSSLSKGLGTALDRLFAPTKPGEQSCKSIAVFKESSLASTPSNSPPLGSRQADMISQIKRRTMDRNDSLRIRPRGMAPAQNQGNNAEYDERV